MSEESTKSRYPHFAMVLAVALLCGVLAWSGVMLTRDSSRIAAVWLPNALLIAVLLRSRYNWYLVYLPGCFVANVIANLLSGDMVGRAVGLGIANCLEVMLIYGAMRRFGLHRPNMADNRHLIHFVAFTIGAASCAGIVATLVLVPSTFDEAMSIWWRWTRTDALGMLLLAPAILILSDAWQKRTRPSRAKLIEIVAIICLGLVSTLYISWQTRFPFLFLDAPVVLLYAFRLGPAGTAFSILLVAVVASVMTAFGHGPIQLVRGDLADKLLVLQVFLTSSFAMGLPVAAVLASKRTTEEELHRQRALSQSMIENMREIIFRIGARGRWEFLNPAWEGITGYTVDESIGWHCTKLFHPDDMKDITTTYPKIVSGEMDQCLLRQRFIRADGAERDIEVSVQALRNEDGRFAGAIGNIRDVTDQKLAERALEESEMRFRYLADAAPLGIYRADANGQVTYANAAWSRIIGIPAEQAMGDGWMAALADRTTYSLEPGWKDLERPGDIRRRRLDYRHPNGQLVITDNSSAAEFGPDGLPVGFIGVVMDITSEMAATEALTAAKRVFETLASLSPAGIFRTDGTGACTYVNAAWLKLSGLTEQGALGPGWVTAIHPDDRERVWKEWGDAVAANDQFRSDFRFLRPGGEISWVDVIASPELAANGAIVGFIGVNIDISERKKLELQLVSAKRHAEAAGAAKSRFLANMSHEIRTPMNGVLGFADLLLDSELGDEQRKHVSLIAESGRAMMQLLNDILDISKVEAGQVRIAQDCVDLRHVINSCVKLMTPNATDKGLALHLKIDKAVPRQIIGDGLRLRQIVLNLLGNAIKFTQQGHVRARVSASPAHDDQVNLTIAIEDTGIGIAPERQAAIFTPFEQADDSTSRRFGGTGLGLTISRQLVELMGGQIALNSVLGKGSTFIMSWSTTIPQETPQDDRVALERTAIEMVEPQSGSARILLAEDHDINQILVTAMLKKLGYNVELAIDGADAVSRIEAARDEGRLFDLVLMDIQMPYVDGYQAARTVRASGLTPQQLPIIALTANAYADDIAACLDAGMQGHIAKPVSSAKLAEMLDHWIKQIPAEPAKDINASLVGGGQDKLNARYAQRREDMIASLLTLVQRGQYDDPDVEDAISHLHKLAGTAGMFGDYEVGEMALALEHNLTDWPHDERLKHAPAAVEALVNVANGEQIWHVSL